MAKLPKMDPRLKVEAAIEDGLIKSRLSRHIGPSSLGDPCARAVWFGFRNFTRKAHSPRILRLFGRGHNEEPIVIKDLVAVNVEVISTQEKAVFAHGHGNAYSDGRVKNIPDAPKTEHLLEIKTSNTRNFNSFVKHGIEKTNIKYWVQIQVYMSLFKMKRCLYIIVNKETDERLYLRIKYDKDVAEEYLERAVTIVNYMSPPPGLTGGATFQCRWCDHKEVCREGATPLRTCRSCTHFEPMEGGKWYCSTKRKNLKNKAQKKACKLYQQIRV